VCEKDFNKRQPFVVEIRNPARLSSSDGWLWVLRVVREREEDGRLLKQKGTPGRVGPSLVGYGLNDFHTGDSRAEVCTYG